MKILEDWFEGRKHLCKTICESCEKEFIQTYFSNQKYIHKFCSHKCINTGRKHTQEWKDKMSLRNSGEGNPFYGKKHDEKIRKIMSEKSILRLAARDENTRNDWKQKISASSTGEKNGFFGKRHDEETCARMSNTRATKIANGEISSNVKGLKGLFISRKTGSIERYDSFYEFLRMKMLDDDDNVSTWKKKHGIKIQYKIDEKQKNYIPDFFVNLKDGSIRIEEIKGYEKEKFLIAKLNSLEKYCKENNYTMSFIDADTFIDLVIKHFGKSIKVLMKEHKS